ncbi:glycosyltransferase family 2 protein [Capnocytophaga cynodegmi]|uniref:glycosyltransferase family 2 protein n=1 Tax=Capnocytophaga cynodegmi TaxID=28189 RepID=UPI00385E1B05
MQLSIVIPVYNTENFLKECIQSLLDQNISQEDFEIILINDGSTDNSLALCYELSRDHSNIKIITQENRGQSIARNVGLREAEGTYILFVDSDDYLKSGYLSDFLKIIKKNDLDFLGFRTYNTSKRYTNNTQKENLILETQGTGLQIIDEHSYYNGSCWFIFKKDIAENLYFEEGRLCEDVVFTTQLLLRVKKGEVYKNEIYGYRFNSDSTLRTKDLIRLHKINDDMFYTVTKFSDIIDSINFKKGHEKGFKRLKARQESYTYFAIIRFIRNKRNFKELRQKLCVLESCKHSGYPITNFKGYTYKDKILIKCLNNKIFLYLITNLNCIFSFIK